MVPYKIIPSMIIFANIETPCVGNLYLGTNNRLPKTFTANFTANLYNAGIHPFFQTLYHATL